MLNFYGTRRRLCDGVNRRQLLQIGGLGALGLLGSRQADAGAAFGSVDTAFGRAKSCILLFLYGSPPQHETFDPKPEAPAEIQGEMKAISSCIPGYQIGEGLPRVAQMLDKVTVVRSMTHEYPVHGVAYAVSGIPVYTPDLETRARDSRHWPYLGSVVDHFFDRAGQDRDRRVPRHMALPWMLNSKTDLLVNAGPFAAFLGAKYDPVWTDYTGTGTRKVPKYTDGQQQEFLDPFGGLTTEGKFTLASNAQRRDDLSVERLGLRRSLLAQYNSARLSLEQAAGDLGYAGTRDQAASLLTSPEVHRALDVDREPQAIREEYGMTLFGQSCLVARRLVEAGTRFVTVFWDGYGQFANCAWDTHNNHYPRLKEYLLPGFDLAYPALIRDLDRRGLLDETLVLCISEHGRTPQIDPKPKGAGRHHWSRAYSAVLAGGGIARGRIVGKTDRLAGEVVDVPVSPKDLLATSLHLMGFDPEAPIYDRLGRPLPATGSGAVRRELLG